MKFFIQFMLLLGLIYLPFLSFATCSVDNTTAPNGVTATTASSLAGQQFLACETNSITSLQVQTMTGGDIDLYLVAGDGSAINYGTPYQTFPAQSSGLITLTLDIPFSVTNNSLYAFAIGNTATGLDVVFDMVPVGPPVRPDLPNGQYSFTFSNLGVFALNTPSDLVFGVNIAAPPAIAAVASPIPTMSQWGLMIFGLLVMNLGIFFVQRIAFT